MDMATIFLGIERDRDGKQIDSEKRADSLRRLRAEAVSRFGGYTLMHGEGAEQDGQPEAMVRLDVLAQWPSDINEFALWAGRLFNQRGVLVRYRQNTYLAEVRYSPNDPRHAPGIMSPIPAMSTEQPALYWPLNQAHPRLAGYRDANPGRAGAVLKAVREWDRWLNGPMKGASYHAYCRAFKRLERAAKKWILGGKS